MNAHARRILSTISDIERRAARSMREAVLGDPDALKRLRSAEAEINRLRRLLAAGPPLSGAGAVANDVGHAASPAGEGLVENADPSGGDAHGGAGDPLQ